MEYEGLVGAKVPGLVITRNALSSQHHHMASLTKATSGVLERVEQGNVSVVVPME